MKLLLFIFAVLIKKVVLRKKGIKNYDALSMFGFKIMSGFKPPMLNQTPIEKFGIKDWNGLPLTSVIKKSADTNQTVSPEF